MSATLIRHASSISRLRTAVACVAIAALASGCASLSSRSGRIDVDPERGFTITEEFAPGAGVASSFDDALRLLRAGRNDEAITLLLQVVESQPDLTAAHINLGIAYERDDDLESAERALRAAISLNPKHPVAHNELGIVYRKLGRFEKARDSYERALDVYPDFHFARRNLAVLCDVYLLDAKCAYKNYEIYTQLVPEDEAASMWLADLRNRMEE